MATRRILVHGRVQQVGFRAFVLRRAGELGIAGHVRNTADGKVEVIASGREIDLNNLEEYLRDGPPLALVTRIESNTLPHQNLQGFQVLA